MVRLMAVIKGQWTILQSRDPLKSEDFQLRLQDIKSHHHHLPPQSYNSEKDNNSKDKDKDKDQNQPRRPGTKMTSAQ